MKSDYPRYIEIEPSCIDQFEGKPHERIAEVISKQLQEKDNTLRIIGIEGKWGSGKSTVISILKKKLNDKHKVALFDLWGHQEDAFKRSFIEEITDVLTKFGGFNDNDDFEKEKEKILGKVITKNTKNIPRFSIGTIALLLAFFITPIFQGIVSSDWILFWKIVFPLIPIVAAFYVLLLIADYESNMLKNRDNTKRDFWNVFWELFYLYQGKEIESSTEELISEKEPSVRQFKKWLLNINNKIENSTITEKLLIVFDNIDRLPIEKIKEFWSLIHTFFANDSCYPDNAYKNIQVIIPFDRTNFIEVFDQNNSKSCEPVNRFIEKTFSTIFYVSPPILSDWKNFFRTKFAEAFGENSGHEEEMILSIFGQQKNNFTPRDIVFFINELVSLRLIWSSVQLKYLALFSLKKEEILKNPLEVIVGTNYYNNFKHYFTNEKELENTIAAITFNVSLEKANEIILYHEIKSDLETEKIISKLNLLSADPCFLDVLEELIHKFTSSGNFAERRTIIRKLSTIKKYKYLCNSRFTAMWDNIAETIFTETASVQSVADCIKQNQILFSNCSFEMCFKMMEVIPKDADSNILITYILRNNLQFTRYLIRTSEEWVQRLTQLLSETIKKPLGDKFSQNWISSNEYLFDLTLILFEETKLSNLPVQCFDLCQDILLETHSNTNITIEKLSRWTEILHFALEDTQIEPLIQRILLDYIKSDQIVITPEKFMFFEPWFQKYCDIELIAAEYCRVILTTVIENVECLNLIVKDKKYLQIIKKAGTDAEVFKDKIRTALENQQNNEELKEFVSAIGEFQ